jgi:cytochrome P450
VRSKYGRGARDAEAMEGKKASSTKIPTKKGATTTQTTLTDDEIISNAFIMLLAGHETTANTLLFTLLELAQNPASQRRLQQDIDSILGRDSDPATWQYEDTINAMMASMLGACMNETLRWMPPVPEVPKMVTPHRDQPVILEDGKKVDLPAGANLRLAVIGAHRNPRFWPGKPSRVKGREGEDDLDDWVPERWFRSGVIGKETANRDAAAAPIIADLAGKVETETSTVEEISTQFRPVRGSFIPFSDGSRSCLGRRMAQVEMVAALAVVFQRHSVELAVEEWATDDEVEALSDEEKVALYEKARAKARDTIRTAAQIITLKLHGRHVPIRLVPRGQERFVGLVDV